jgi:hypothetical protein
VVPAQFLHERSRETRVLLQLGQLIRMLEQSDDPEVDHVDHCCVASDKEEEGNLDCVFFA